jgi:hypothetical protein
MAKGSSGSEEAGAADLRGIRIFGGDSPDDSESPVASDLFLFPLAAVSPWEVAEGSEVAVREDSDTVTPSTPIVSRLEAV